MSFDITGNFGDDARREEFCDLNDEQLLEFIDRCLDDNLLILAKYAQEELADRESRRH